MIKISELLKIHKLKSKLEYIAEEIHRSARFGYNFSIIAIEFEKTLNNPDIKSSEQKLQFNMVKKHLRPYDQIINDEKDKYCIILPQTDGIGCSIVIDRVRELCRNKQLNNISFGTAIYPNDGTNANKLLNKAVERLKKFKDKNEDVPVENS